MMEALKNDVRYFYLSDALPAQDWELNEITADKSKLGRTCVFLLERMSKGLQPLFVPYSSMTRKLSDKEQRK